LVVAGARTTARVQQLLENKPMILFLAKTWFLWWMFAIVFIVRWFNVVSARTTTEDLDVIVSRREDPRASTVHLLGEA
jgi:hypothetical protein